MWELDYKQSWAPKNWSFWTVVLEKTLESPLDSKKIKPKRNQPWIFIRKTDAEAPILWPLIQRVYSLEKTRPWCWKRLKVGGEGDDRGWDGWMASQTQWRWVCANSGRWWKATWRAVTHGSQGVRHDWTATRIQRRETPIYNQGREKILCVAERLTLV